MIIHTPLRDGSHAPICSTRTGRWIRSLRSNVFTVSSTSIKGILRDGIEITLNYRNITLSHYILMTD